MGKFITLEGGEGAGKTSQARLLAAALASAGIKVRLTREPGGCRNSEQVRELLLHSETMWCPPAEIFLHFAARAQHAYEVIIPTLQSGTWVVCDRFYDSTMAYQGYGMYGDQLLIERLSDAVGVRPDLTLVLNVSKTVAETRLAEREAAPDRYEQMTREFHQRVREGFLSIAWRELDRCCVVPADSSIEAVHRQVLLAVHARLAGAKALIDPSGLGWISKETLHGYHALKDDTQL